MFFELEVVFLMILKVVTTLVWAPCRRLGEEELVNTGVTEGGRACQWPWRGAAEPSGWEWARVWKAAFPPHL